jgi:hypothetical protein
MKRILLSLFFSMAFVPVSFAQSSFKTEYTAKKLLKSKYKITIESDKKVFKKMEPVKVKLTLQDMKNNYVKNADIIMDLTMPDMYMPKNEVKFKAEKNYYYGELVFTMRGDWRLNTIITNAKNKSETFFDVVVE